MKLKKGFRQMVDEAKARIKTIGLDEAKGCLGKDDMHKRGSQISSAREHEGCHNR